MKISRLAILVLSICLLTAPLLAYSLDGGGVPTTDCNDGEDNDGDGLIDGEGISPDGEDPDPGCVRPYYKDDSEGDIYDLDASWIFSGNSTPDSSGPSVFYGWETIEGGAEDSPYKDSSGSSSDEIVEYYVEDSNEEWAGGEPMPETIDITGAGTTDRDGNSRYELVDIPGRNTDQTCGDGVGQDGETTLNCPEDKGLPDDAGLSDSTITDEIGYHDGELVQYDPGSSERTVTREFKESDVSEPLEARSTCTSGSSSSCSDEEKVYGIGYMYNDPDFYLQDDYTEIVELYTTVEDAGVHIGTVTDYGLVSHQYAEITGTSGGGECTSGDNCTGVSSSTECVSKTSKNKKTLSSETVYIGDSDSGSEKFEVEDTSDYGYDLVRTDQSTRLKVKVNKKGGNSGSFDHCTSWSTVEYGGSCTGNGGCSGSGDTYLTTSGETYYTEYKKSDKKYYYDEINFHENYFFDLNPDKSLNPTTPREALFNGDIFHEGDSNEGSWSDITYNVFNDKAYFSWPIQEDGKDQGNNPAVSYSEYQIDVVNDEFKSERIESHTFDADGWDGQGDGYIAISGGNIISSTQDFLSREVQDGSVVDNFVSNSDVPVPDCPGDSTKCMASVDVSLKNLDNWGSINPNSGLDFHFSTDGPYSTDASLGVCMMYKKLSGDENVQCGYTPPPRELCGPDGTGNGIDDDGDGEVDENPPCDGEPQELCGPDGTGNGIDDDGDGEVDEGCYIPPTSSGSCGDQPYEHWVNMEGPEIDEDVMMNYQGDYQKCIDTSKNDVTKSSCNLKGDTVPEGYVGNVAPNPGYSDAKYEEGGNSPDWEVCLDMRNTGIGDEGDEVLDDNENDDINDEDYGGEWYDLDSEEARKYLRGVEDGTYSTQSGRDLVSDGEPDDPNDIAYYWKDDKNPPQDDEHNPQGGKEGIAMEDDCGNPRFDSLRCDDQADVNDRGHGDSNTFFSFFEEGHREEDFYPQGVDADVRENLDGFEGVVNRMQERSDQLEPGMDTEAYESDDYTIWEDTRGGDYADVWAISAYLNWSIDSTGTPYPPYSTWYRDESTDKRTSPEDESIDKMQKAFGNSYAAVAVNSFTGDSGVSVEPGDGVWIDPDSMKTAEDVKLVPEGSSSEDPLWREALRRTDTRSGINNGFKIDITGKDAGIGMNISDSEDPECLKESGDGGCMVVANVTEWEKNDDGDIESELEPPMCGDDRYEYFVEQAGEIDYSNRYIGPYACADSRNSCYDRDSDGEPSLVDQGEYRNVDEPEEDEGRLKDDAEYCQKVDSSDHEDDFAVWYDQDYRESFCNENILYGKDGVRWFDEEYVTDYPQAVKGGIDDSWNDYLEQHGHESFESKIGEVNPASDVTPVPTGDKNDFTATRGFCGGDDDGEYLVTQECNTRYCETDRTIQGVAKVPGSCVMRAEDSLYENGISERSIYKPGERVEITGVSGDPKVACFNGVWFADWPISFHRDEVEVPVGSTKTVSFDVINTRNDETNYKVTMEKDSESPSADQFAQFTQHSGDSFTTTVDGASSKTFRIELTGGNENLDNSDLTVRADAINAGAVGSDSLEVSIVPKTNTGSGTSTGETRDVPGVQSLQLLMMIIISTLIYVRRRS